MLLFSASLGDPAHRGHLEPRHDGSAIIGPRAVLSSCQGCFVATRTVLVEPIRCSTCVLAPASAQPPGVLACWCFGFGLCGTRALFGFGSGRRGRVKSNMCVQNSTVQANRGGDSEWQRSFLAASYDACHMWGVLPRGPMRPMVVMAAILQWRVLHWRILLWRSLRWSPHPLMEDPPEEERPVRISDWRILPPVDYPPVTAHIVDHLVEHP